MRPFIFRFKTMLKTPEFSNHGDYDEESAMVICIENNKMICSMDTNNVLTTKTFQFGPEDDDKSYMSFKLISR